MPATTQRPSVIASAAGPSHGSITALAYGYIARCAAGILDVFLDHASGTRIVLAIGAERPARTSTSSTASSAAESDDPGWMIGLMSSCASPNAPDAILISWLRIQLALPRSVLISPLCASI